MVEQGEFTLSKSLVKVPAPLANACDCLLCLQLVIPFDESPPALEFAKGTEDPIAWVPVWHFDRRAAQSPRAPSPNQV